MTRKKVKPPRLVCIHWLDHHSDDEVGWKNPKELEKSGATATSCLSVGWVLKETKTMITIVSSWNSNGVDGDVSIVKKAIADIWELSDPSLDVRALVDLK